MSKSITRSPVSTLHLQMGQEVMYLLLVTSLIANFVLATLAIRGIKQSEVAAKQLGALKNLPQPPIMPQDQPPIITLREADGFSFPPGSADVSPEFLARLPDVVRKLAALSERYGAQIVEVIGHTDGTSIRDTLRNKANLDDALGQYLDPASTAALFPSDNVGLGISRAVSVARALRTSGLPANLDIQPLSASYLIAPNDRTDPAARRVGDASRRRIKIRIRQSQRQLK
jgi:outer membrane protein OmpA-like peptidoglycan-associated protein